MYEDGSFDRYYFGNVLMWEGPRPMTYGADYIPQDFIIDIARDKVNRERISAGKLVLVCNEINRVEYSLTPVEFSGNALSCTVENDEVVLFLAQNSVQQWSSGHSIGWVIADTIKVNDVLLSEWSANMELSNRRGYLPLTESDEFQIAVTRGTKMETVDCVVDKRYYFQDLESEFDLQLDPTADGYAIVDLSDIPAGEYLIHYSYWNSDRGSRSVLSTHVVVD